MVYHIFNYLIQGVWYRDSTTYSDEQFSHIMDVMEWRLPANIRVYHYGGPDGRRYALTNRIMLERPILTLDPLLLFSSVPRVRVGLHDKVLRRDFTVIRQVGLFVLAEGRGEWPRLYYADGVGASLIQPLELVPLSFRTASEYVRRYIRKEKGVVSLVLGQYADGGMQYCGHVTLGVGGRDFERISKAPVSQNNPFNDTPAGNEQAVWLVPGLVGTVKFMEKTASGSLRQPVFKGLRDDKAPRDCVV